MDIEKEREAFEAIAENIRLLRGAKFKDGKYVALSLFDESSKEFAAQLNYGLSMWLSAKAQAVPKGYVVASTKDLNIIYDQINDWNTDWPLVFGLFNRILEAQEPAND